MRIVVIGDVHGLEAWRNVLENAGDYDKVIFIGDYVDSHNLLNKLQYFNLKDIIEFKETYPNLNKILIDERNEYMVNQILDYIQNNPSHHILIIVGAGHLEELIRLTEENLSKTKNI